MYDENGQENTKVESFTASKNMMKCTVVLYISFIATFDFVSSMMLSALN